MLTVLAYGMTVTEAHAGMGCRSNPARTVPASHPHGDHLVWLARLGAAPGLWPDFSRAPN